MALLTRRLFLMATGGAALLLGVDNPLAAGILAILGIDTTRWRGMKTVFARFVASVLGLIVSDRERIGSYGLRRRKE